MKVRNGTQLDIDKATDDATQIPFNVLFRSKYGDTKGTIVNRIKDINDPIGSVAMINANDDWDYLDATDLEVIE